MSALSEKIAAEHQASLGFDDEIHCSCANWTATFGIDDFEAHLIEGTERAVRDTIAQQLEDGRQAIHDTWIAAHHRLTPIPAAVCEAYTQAARIAKEGTTP